MSDLTDLYREVILDHNRQPRNFREIAAADRTALGDNPLCGDVVTVYANVTGDQLDEVAFQGAGCAISQASASLMTEAVQGMSVTAARELSVRFRALLTGGGDGENGGEALGKLAVFSGVRDYPMRVKCATLPWHTLTAALDQRPEPVSTEE